MDKALEQSNSYEQFKLQTDMEDNQKILDEAAEAAAKAAEKNLTEEKTGGLKSLVKFQTLLMFVGGLLIFGLIALYFSNSGMKELWKNQAGLAKNDSIQQVSIDATNEDVRSLKDSFRIHAEEDSLTLIAIGNDLTRHDEEIKKLQKRGSGVSGSYVKSLENRLFVVEKDLSSLLVVRTETTNTNTVVAKVNAPSNDEGDEDEDEDEEDEGDEDEE